MSSFAIQISSPDRLNKFFNVMQFFSKIGKYIILEVDDDTLVLRTLNDAKSAFSSVEFEKREFFDEFELESDQNSRVFACKLLIRPLVVILRKAKKMQSLRIFNSNGDGAECELVFVLVCDTGIRRCHRFMYQTCDIVSAMFSDNNCNRLRVMPKVLTQLFGHIAKSLEVEVDVSPEQFKMKSFHQQSVSDALSKKQSPHTLTSEMCVSPEEFDVYEFKYSQKTAELAFCCKELKAILWLCDTCDIPDLNIYFTEGGSPVKFTCEDRSMSCNLIMATLEPCKGIEKDDGYVSSASPNQYKQQSGNAASVEGDQDHTASRMEDTSQTATSRLHRTIMGDQSSDDSDTDTQDGNM